MSYWKRQLTTSHRHAVDHRDELVGAGFDVRLRCQTLGPALVQHVHHDPVPA
ncbi:hypothetical protein [Streptomyces sp. NPDC059272]|uniref:hypothetical protein n=1 Tax=Streptomyces sp. NPDC059272 TaxID=3346800 RepID=UPI003688AF2C